MIRFLSTLAPVAAPRIVATLREDSGHDAFA